MQLRFLIFFVAIPHTFHRLSLLSLLNSMIVDAKNNFSKNFIRSEAGTIPCFAHAAQIPPPYF